MVKLNTSDVKKRQSRDAFIPSLEQIKTDKITELAQKYWASYSTTEHAAFDSQIVEEIYANEIQRTNFQTRRIQLLEISQYLENYLWPNFDVETSSHSFLMSIICMVNEKNREGVPMWDVFQKEPEKFHGFFVRVLESILAEDKTSILERCTILSFLSCAFSSLEVELVRKQIQSLVSLHIWHCLSEGRREQEFQRFPKWKKYWKAMLKRDEKESAPRKEELVFARTFLSNLIKNFFTLIEMQDYMTPELDRYFLLYCEKFMELMVDLHALLPTRRYVSILVDDLHLVVKCQLSLLIEHGDGHLFSQLLDRLKFYSQFEINNESGDPLSELEVMTLHYQKITKLQEQVFVNFPEMRTFALCNVNSIDTRKALLKSFQNLNFGELQKLAVTLNLVNEDEVPAISEQLLKEIIVFNYERRVSQIKRLNAMALYPTEEMIWDENVVPSSYHSANGQVLALPKLNLQFLTLHDYLLRNFQLFRLESTYQIRQDIEDAVFRMKPWRAENGGTLFHGWARMAQPVVRFAVVEVSKPNLGESQPSRVRADIHVNLNVRNEVKSEWESLRKHDACFLISVQPKNTDPTRYDLKGDFVTQVGLTYVRGCEIEGMLDSNGRVIEEGPEPRPHITGDSRTFRVFLDCNQYKIDMDAIVKGEEDVYETFNIFLRRKPKENNFKAVLETIRDLMNINCVVPDWLHDVILGYGDPGSAHYSRLPQELSVLDFNDTFHDLDHIRNSFPEYKVEVKDIIQSGNDIQNVQRPFRLKFKDVVQKKEGVPTESQEKVIEVEPYMLQKRGPYPANEPNLNKILFTPTQVEAIRSGMQPGLTVIVGPPGTGKTDVATQIISNIYHNFPDQRTLIVTHSNQALNQLFEKIIALDVDERHLLRLGHGEEELDTEKDFSRYGRVNFVLAKRIDLLGEVEKLQKSLDAQGDVAYTCETSGFFFVYHVLARWEEFNIKIKQAENKSPDLIEEAFPFNRFFADAPQPLFRKVSFEEDREIAESCFRYIKRIFEQLDEFRAFELLRTGLDRSRYLLVKEAKIIAMTCTHAALKRKELVDLIFQYDNILMEESAQILEIETFIPLLLQNPEQGRLRLKRWTMIGDHHQLPPVIKNMAFQKYGNMEQSLFARFVRLGVPTVELDAQGRARSSISELYKWRYKSLGDLPHVQTELEYKLANAGFTYDYQLINVEDFNGVGESEPIPYFFQNLAEAEYVVATFMYMRLLGYPAEKITILTTYNGQKALIRDVISTRCGKNPLIGFPHKIATVDKYQGQQNDYILLSLVRTRNVGHLRDVRRLIVAMSRARLGLYIFGRIPLFSNCFELSPAFKILTKRPPKLHVHPSEVFPTERMVEDPFKGDTMVFDEMQQMVGFVYEMYLQKVKSLGQQQPVEEVKKPLDARKVQPTPIIFEKTFIIEKPAEIVELPEKKVEAIEVDKEGETESVPEKDPS